MLLAYAKITLYAALLESDLPEDTALDDELDLYFPAPLPERFGDVMRRHRLRREIVATRVTNDLIDRAGTTFVFRLRDDTGASPADIARASIVARDVFGVRALWEEIEALDGVVAADVQSEMLLSVAPLGRARDALAAALAAAAAGHRGRDRALRARARGSSRARCRASSSSPSRRRGASGSAS